MSARLLILLVATGLLLQTGVGHADAIDGDWCSTDGMRMSIHGEKITIPSGKQIQGNYSRHAFDYVVPAGKTAQVMSSVFSYGESILRYRTKGQSKGFRKEWHRCKESIS